MIETLLIGATGAAIGGLLNRLWTDRQLSTSSICPACYGPLDGRTSEAWGAKLQAAEGKVILDPDDDSEGFLVLDGGRVGRVDVVEPIAALIDEDAARFTPDDVADERGDQS